MAMGVTIGEFARLSHLSSKTLRYYHEIQLLVPASVDGATGYRRYAPEQVDDAHLIRRLRDLDMPLAEIRRVLDEPDRPAREQALARHLDRMEAELLRTREVVVSLRRLLGTVPRGPITHRQSPGFSALATTATLARAEVAPWCGETYPRLYQTLGELGLDPAGPGGATYAVDFFEQDAGQVSAYVPVRPDLIPADDERFVVMPPGRFAVAVHSGPFTDCDLTYGWLGGHVAEHDVALSDPIVEIYLIGPDHTPDPNQFKTEICWPIR